MVPVSPTFAKFYEWSGFMCQLCHSIDIHMTSCVCMYGASSVFQPNCVLGYILHHLLHEKTLPTL